MTEKQERLTPTELTYVDTSALKFGATNRELDRKHVAKLKLAISEDNKLYLSPITVNTKFEVIDGQHRTAAARELNLDTVPCIVVQESVDSAADINQNMKNWTGMDFAHYWAKKGNEHYKTFLAFVKRTGMNQTVAVTLLSGETKTSKHLANFKAGLFTVKKSEKGDYMWFLDKFIERLEDFRPYLKDNYHDRSFILAYWSMHGHPLYDHERMVAKLKITGMTRRTDIAEYREQLDEIYNYKVRAEDRVKLSV